MNNTVKMLLTLLPLLLSVIGMIILHFKIKKTSNIKQYFLLSVLLVFGIPVILSIILSFLIRYI